jgi:hypothetical protein
VTRSEGDHGLAGRGQARALHGRTGATGQPVPAAAATRFEEAKHMAITSWLPKVGQVVSTIAAAVAAAAQSAPSSTDAAKDRVAKVVAAALGDPDDTAAATRRDPDATAAVAAPAGPTVAAEADADAAKGSAWRRVAMVGLIAAGSAVLAKVLRDSQPRHDPWATPLEPEGAARPVPRRPYDPADAGPAAARAVVKERVTTAAETVKELSTETVETVKDKVTAATETAKELSAETVETVKDKVTAATETAKETASHARSTVVERVEHLKSRAGTPAGPGAQADAADPVPGNEGLAEGLDEAPATDHDDTGLDSDTPTQAG